MGWEVVSGSIASGQLCTMFVSSGCIIDKQEAFPVFKEPPLFKNPFGDPPDSLKSS